MKNYLYIISIGCLLAIGCGGAKKMASITAIADKKKLSPIFFEANKARLQKDNAKAKDLYKQAITQDPSNAAAYYYYAKINMATGDALETVTFSKKATELVPENKYYKELYAEALANNGDVKKAIGLYKTLSEIDTKLAERYLMTAAYYEAKIGLNEDAIQTMDLLEKYYGVSPEMSFRKINLLTKLKKTEEVTKELDKLIKEDPNELKYYLLKIENLESAKQFEKAKIITLEMETRFANSAELLPSATLKAFEKKDTATYFKLLQQCMDSKGIEPEEKIALLIPIMQFNTKDTLLQQKIIGYGKNMVDASPEDGKAITFYANILSNYNEYDKALVQYIKLITKNPNQIDTWQQVFFIYAQQEKNDSLIAITKRALDYFPNQASVYYMNGVGHQQKNNMQNAIKAFNKALDFAEGNKNLQLQIYTALGDAFNTQKEYIKSDSAFEKCLLLDGDNATVLNNYAYYLSVRNTNLDYAATMSKKSLAIRKDEKTFLDTYAWILYMQKKYEEAAIVMKQALTDNTDNDATMLEHYGDILFKKNDKINAKKYWQLAKQKGSKSIWIDKKIENGEMYE
jgi:tetratricopeptide (TPR) repeat protein